MRALRRQGRKMAGAIGAVTAALRSVPSRTVMLLPRRLRRALDKIERNQIGPVGAYSATGFLAASAFYGFVAGGHLDGLVDRLLVGAGLSVQNVDITGHSETSELAVLERLEIDGTTSLLGYDVSEARNRITGLPWVGSASVRKLYPKDLVVTVTEREPFALWQRGNVIMVIDRTGTPIVEYADSRFASLPLVVGYGAETGAREFIDRLNAHPALSVRTRASVFVSERRWNLVLDSGITIKLPEQDAAAALDTLVRFDREEGLLARNVSEIDLRLDDRIIVRIADDPGSAISNEDRVEIRQLARAGGAT